MNLPIKKIFLILLPALAVGLMLPAAVLASGAPLTMSTLAPLFGTATLGQIIIRLIQIILALLGLVAVALLIYAGFMWMTSAGEPHKVEKAKQIIYAVVIGLIIIFAAFAITAFLFNYFGPPPPPPPCDPLIDPLCGSSCTADQDCSTDGGRCAGLRYCIGGHLSGCQKLNSNCPGSQWAKIVGFKADSLTWSSFNLSQPIGIPKVDDLQSNGSAYYKGGSFTGANLWWGPDVMPPSFVSSSVFVGVPPGVETFNSTFAPFDILSYATGSVIKVKITAQPSGASAFDSAILRTIIRPAHCFNNVKDSGETGVYCGGECGGCPGSSCDSDLSNSICDADNSLCRWGGCDPTTCLCAVMPSIYYISPAKDINGDDVESQPETYKDDVGNGAIGNYITIWGRGFGNATGTVYFRDRSSGALIEAPLADDCPVPAACSAKYKDYWTGTQIIAKVPAGASVVSHTSEADVTAATGNYDVFVVTDPGLSSLDNPNADFAKKLFEVNQIDRPGICNMCPNHGAYPTSTAISGNKFPTSGTQDIIWYFKAYDPGLKIWLPNNVTSTGSGWSASQVTNSIPQNKNGLTSIRIYNGSQFSNYYKFLISAGNIGDPCGFDFGSCVPSSDVCLSPLVCDPDSCTCKSAVTAECKYHPTSTSDLISNESRSCTIGGCSGTQYCGRDNKWAPGCAPIAGCVPFLGASASRSMFSWAFIASKYTGPGMSCKSTVWNDDTCDLGGCVDASGRRDNNLSCDINATTGEWLELFNAGSTNIDLTNWRLVTEQPISNKDLLYYYPLEIPSVCAVGSSTECYPQNLAPGNISGSPALSGTGHWYDFQTAKFSRGISFNGTNAALYLSATDAYNTTAGDFSWSAWYEPVPSPVGSEPTIISRGTSNVISLAYRANSRFVFSLFNKAGNQTAVLSQSHSTGQWYHLVGVYNGQAKTIKIYVNGRLEGTAVMPSGSELNRQLPEPLVIGGIYGVGPGDTHWANGLIDDVKLFTRVLSDSEVAALASKNAFNLSGSINSSQYLRVGTATIPNFALSQFSGNISLLDNNGVVDDLTYGPSAITPAYSPGSFGRIRDGLDTGSNSDFGYFTNGTPGATNNPGATAVGDHLVINEVSLSHEACTCVPKQQLCQPATSDDRSSCQDVRVGVCATVRTCDEYGHWGECLAVPGCNPYPLIPGAETAVFTWGILIGYNPGDGPKVVIDCSRSATCNVDDTLPSPVPWDARWNKTNYPHLYITKPLACVNSVISARFTQAMDTNTLTISHGIRVFRHTGGTTWEDVSSDFSVSGSADGFRLVFATVGNNLVPDTQYRVVLTSDVKDELGRRLVIDNQVRDVLTSEDCYNSAVLSAGGLTASDIRFCWNFTTRPADDPDVKCPIGCIDCNPDKYFNRYFGQEKQHEATPISADNVCLQLDGRNYSWSWNEEQQTAGNWAKPYPAIPSGVGFLPAYAENLPWPFSWVTSWAVNSILPGILGNYSASTTAYRESNWRPYADNSSYFSSDDVDYFRIKAQEVLSAHFDVCRVHNNFTDPIVIENQHCSRGSSRLVQVLQSPSPWKNQQDACRNAVIFALFSRNMFNDSLVNSGSCDDSGRCSTIYNIDVYDCGDDSNVLSAGRATSSSATTGCTLVQNLSTPITLTARIFNYAHENLTLNDLINAPSTVDDSLKPEGIRLYPSANLEIHRWYKIIIRGGDNGVRGASSTPATGGEKPEGILRIPSANAQYNDASHPDSYYWYFKTSAEVCPIDQVAVLPQAAFMPTVGETQQYDADPQAANCNHLNPYLYKWQWNSLIDPYDADTGSCDAQTASGIANICQLFDVSCSGLGNNPNVPTVKAFGQSEGHVWIKARAIDTHPTSTPTCQYDKSGFGELQIGTTGFFRIIGHDYTECLNPDISFGFSADANSISLSASSIRLYQCAINNANCDLAGATALPITIEYPFNAGTASADPIFANQVMFTPTPPNLLSTTTSYRVVVMGGVSGIKSFANDLLGGLNFNTSPGVVGGEACDPQADPWKGTGVCSPANCKYISGVNFCGTPFEECNTQGLRAYFDLNNSRLTERTGRHPSMTNSGLSFAGGKSGQAAYFAGNSYIQLGNDVLNPDIATVSLWVKPDKAADNYFAHLFSVSAGGDLLSLTYGNDNNVFKDKDGNSVARRFVFSYATGGNSVKLVSPQEYGAGQWHNVAAAWNRSAGSFALYIDGAKATSTANIFTSPFAAVTSAYLGRAANVNNYYLTGAIDELAIYDAALTDAKLKALYSGIKPNAIIWGCSDKCLKLGNPNLASCGNRIVEVGEDCDDGNNFDGDGCSGSCLWEGSNSKYNSVCGNGKIQYGEQCDPGNDTGGQGCSSKCLYESTYGTSGAYAGFACGTLNKATTTVIVSKKSLMAKSVCQTPGSNGCTANCLHIGSNPDVPVCGNGKVEDGEECDDGADNGSGKSCLTNCLWKGNSNTGTGAGQCGNGILDNGQPDSYYWTFKLSANTQVCEPVSFGVNPCPNGIWWFGASRDVTDLRVRILTPSDTNIGSCIKDDDLRQVGFWRRMLNFFVRAVTRFLGIHSAMAVEFWCPVSDQKYSSNDRTIDPDLSLASMGYGNYKRDVPIRPTENYNMEIIGFTGEDNRYKINYLNKGNWAPSTNYKILLNYDRSGIPGTSTAEVLTYDRDCALGKVVFDVWPRGVRKARDGFFCYSDPASGKPDDCGRYTSDLYDDDMSTAWTKDYPGNGYNLGSNGTASDVVTNYKDGNNHLYRAWATAKQNPSWAVRADSFNFNLTNILPAQTVSDVSSLTGDYYQGDLWLTSGQFQGRSLLTATATDSLYDNPASPAGNSAVGQEDIWTFFCNNPWPPAANFPYEDNSANCTVGSGTCYNTNFGTYYCRDAGVDKTCLKGNNEFLGKPCTSDVSCWRNPADVVVGSCVQYIADDLASIATYDGARAQNVVSGNDSSACQNLPNNFIPVVGYYYDNGGDAAYGSRNYLWNAAGDAYSRSGGGGWQRVSKGDWEKNGLPVNFKPVVGYSFGAKVYLWDAAGTYLVGSYDGTQNRFSWIATDKGAGLEAGFRPRVGYYGGGKIALWDSQGNYKISTDSGANWSNGNKTNLPVSFKPIIGYYGFSDRIGIWDVQGNYWFSSDGSSWTNGSGSKNGLPPNFKPNFGYFAFTQNHDILWQGSVVYRSDTFGHWLPYSLTDVTCDNKVKEFLFAAISSTPDAIGIRIYSNNNHYSPAQWYQTRFAGQNQGSLTAFSIDGNKAVRQGNTAYINAPDLSVDGSGNANAIYTNIYLMSYNQNAGKDVENIYGQLIKNWYFNAGDQSSGGLFYLSALSTCVSDPLSSQNKCLSDADCLAANKGLCRSDKADLTRDVIRLGDIQDINKYLAAYYNLKRCANDFSRKCATSADCYGGGVCGNFYPNLKAGSYISGKTFSTWPSWQDNLGKDLGAKLPLDPINFFFTTTTPGVCDFPYNPITCWNELAKKMSCALAATSSVYAYYSTESGNKAEVYALGEYNRPDYSKWLPSWSFINGLGYNPFGVYSSKINSGNDFCARTLPICGNGVQNTGEDCSNCPFDFSACTNPNTSCQKNTITGTWQCLLNFACGDGIKEVGEECDGGAGCTNCKCDPGYDCSSGTPSAKCGDGIVASGENCDFSVYGIPIGPGGLPFCPYTGGLNVTYNGQSCCTPNCKRATWFTVTPPLSCGDRQKTDNEQCDCGSVFGANTNNPFTCTTANGVAPAAPYSNSGRSIVDYCKGDCTRASVSSHYCGDHTYDSGEECDGGNGCKSDCKCNTAAGFQTQGKVDCVCPVESTYNPSAGVCVSATCNDGALNTGEDCDSGLGCQPTCYCDSGNHFAITDPKSKDCRCDTGYKLRTDKKACVCDTQDGTYFCYTNPATGSTIYDSCSKVQVMYDLPPAPFTSNPNYCDCNNHGTFQCLYINGGVATKVENDVCLSSCNLPVPGCPNSILDHFHDGSCDPACEDKATDPSCGIRQGDIIGIRFNGNVAGTCNSYNFSYVNPFLGVNSDCSDPNYVNANHGFFGQNEEFQVYFTSDDGHQFLRRGDQLKIVTRNPAVPLAQSVIREHICYNNGDYINAFGRGDELLLTLCDSTGNCSSGDFINRSNSSTPFCLWSTAKCGGLAPGTWYGYMYADRANDSNYPLRMRFNSYDARVQPGNTPPTPGALTDGAYTPVPCQFNDSRFLFDWH